MEEFEKTINRYGRKPDFSAIASKIDFDKYVKEASAHHFPYKLVIPFAAAAVVAMIAVPTSISLIGRNASGSAPASQVDSCVEPAPSIHSEAAEVTEAPGEHEPYLGPGYPFHLEEALTEDDLGEMIIRTDLTDFIFGEAIAPNTYFHLKNSNAFTRVAVRVGDTIRLKVIDSIDREQTEDYPFSFYADLFGIHSPEGGKLTQGDRVEALTAEESQVIVNCLNTASSEYVWISGSIEGKTPWIIELDEGADKIEIEYYPIKYALKIGRSIYDDGQSVIGDLLASKIN